MNDANGKDRLRPLYILCILLLSVGSGSLIGFVFDRVRAGRPEWLILLGVVGFLIAKIYKVLRHAIGLETRTRVKRGAQRFGDLVAWVYSLSMGSMTMVIELDGGSSVWKAATIGIGGVALMLVIQAYLS